MRILLAYDGSAGAETACRLVAQLRLPRGTELAVVSVVDAPATAWSVVDVPMNRRETEGREIEGLKELDAELSNVAGGLRAPDRTCETRILRGRPATVLVDEAERWNADLVVVGNRGHGVLESLLLGSTSAEVVDHAPCPVLVARHPSVHRLVVGVDGSESAEQTVATLVAWPLLRAAPMSVVGVVEPLSAWDFAAAGAAPQAVEMAIKTQEERVRELATQVDEAVAALRQAGALADGEIRKGDAADQLIRAATERRADLVVVGTRGLGMIGRLLLGSVARKVVLHASASVLIVRPVRERIEARQSVGALATV
jgi:nucleotide-binding universal stress UspA family protein